MELDFIKFQGLIDSLDDFRAVDSSHLNAIGKKDGYLVVFFKNNTVYRYRDCALFFDDILTAESPGSFLHKHVKSNSSGEKMHTLEWPIE